MTLNCIDAENKTWFARVIGMLTVYRFQVFIVVEMWIVMPRNLVGGYQCSEMSVIIYMTTWCYNPEDHNPHFRHHENLKSSEL
jgi:hypothetical protein